MKKVTLTPEDKKKFAAEAKKLSDPDFIQATMELDAIKDRFTAEDWKFICSHLGRRAERLLRNVAKNFSFDD
ncbi:MAG: hypothetical protein IKY62_05795 [Clostridia bacterium]|nr:hypothetical protein [Clostridia bacterium]